MLLDIKCPVCNSNNAQKLFALNSTDAGNLIISDNATQAAQITSFISMLWQQDQCSFYTCEYCSYGFSWPYTSGNQEIYSSLYYKEFEYPIEKWEYSKAITILEKQNISNSASLLEVGAGNGAFLNKVSTILKNKTKIFSTEYSKAGVESIEVKGFNCISADISELPKISSLPKFQIICMFQVLEHMNNLNQVFNSINSISLPGSNLIIAVPNGYLRNFYDRIGIHLDVPPIHVGRFSEKTFYVLAEKFGWEVIESFIEPQVYLFKLKKFIFDRFNRNKTAQKTEKFNISILKYFFRYSILIFLLLRHIRVAFKLSSPKTGTSLLVHLKRQAR